LPAVLWGINSDRVSMLQSGTPLSSSGLEEALYKYQEGIKFKFTKCKKVNIIAEFTANSTA